MDPLQQRVLNKLYGSTASLLARTAALEQLKTPTNQAKEELARLKQAKLYIGLAIDLLENDPEVPDEFQVELPF